MRLEACGNPSKVKNFLKMNKIKLIIHERFSEKQTLEGVFLSVFQFESYQLLQDNSSVIMNSTEA